MSNCDCNQGRLPCTCKVSILKDTNVGYAASSAAAPVPPAGDVEVLDEVIDELKMMADMCSDNDDPEDQLMYIRWLARIRRGDAEVTRLTAERDGLLADVALRKAKHLRSCQLAIGKSQLAKQMQSELTKARERIADLERGLKFYADGDHLLLADHDEWDTCSGEPINWLHDNAGTASVEDGSVAKQILNQSAPAAKGGSDE